MPNAVTGWNRGVRAGATLLFAALALALAARDALALPSDTIFHVDADDSFVEINGNGTNYAALKFFFDFDLAGRVGNDVPVTLGSTPSCAGCVSFSVPPQINAPLSEKWRIGLNLMNDGVPALPSIAVLTGNMNVTEVGPMFQSGVVTLDAFQLEVGLFDQFDVLNGSIDTVSIVLSNAAQNISTTACGVLSTTASTWAPNTPLTLHGIACLESRGQVIQLAVSGSAPVPEPSAGLLVAGGIVALAAGARRGRR